MRGWTGFIQPVPVQLMHKSNFIANITIIMQLREFPGGFGGRTGFHQAAL